MNRLLRILEVTVLLMITVTTFSCRASQQASIPIEQQGTAGQGSSLAGLVSDHLGVAVANAPIQAKNKQTGLTARTSSSGSGRFTLSNLATGIYELSITMPCCAFKPFVKDDLKVEGAQNTQLDIRLEQDDYLVTTGLADDPGILAAAVRKQIPVTTARPAPKTPDGRPDLSGVWLVSDDPYPQQPLPLPQAVALAKQRDDDLWKGHPHARCLPWGMPVPFGVGPALAKLVQTPSLLVILFEDTPGFRQVFLDGRNHSKNGDPTWMGHSVGRWDGDVLVVDTVGFNDRAWMNSYPRTEKLHVIERYKRVDFGHLEAHVTIEDPGVFQKPWSINMTWELAPQEEILEFVCENNKFLENIGRK